MSDTELTPFKIDWDGWYIDKSEKEYKKAILFQVREMSTSNNYTCFDYDGNEHHTRECFTLSKEMAKQLGLTE